jgi:DNA-binding transcriptional LysR family regulator
LKALPAFEAAARHLSFTAAAEELHLTHSAISHQMKGLEGELGVPLFRRLNRRVELTEAGNAFLRAVRAALDVLETSAAQISAPAAQGPLVVSCLPTFMMRWLIPRLYDFNARHPDIGVRLSASFAPVDFARDGIDAAIRFGAAPWPEDVEAQPFLDEQIGPVCSPALLKRKGLQRPADLRHHTLLHTESRPDAWPQWFKVSGAKEIEAKAGLRFEHYYFLLEAAVAGLGVAVAPQPLVAEDIRLGRLVAPFDFKPSGRSYFILHPAERNRVAKIKTFRSWIVDVSSDQAFDMTRSSSAGGSKWE